MGLRLESKIPSRVARKDKIGDFEKELKSFDFIKTSQL